MSGLTSVKTVEMIVNCRALHFLRFRLTGRVNPVPFAFSLLTAKGNFGARRLS